MDCKTASSSKGISLWGGIRLGSGDSKGFQGCFRGPQRVPGMVEEGSHSESPDMVSVRGGDLVNTHESGTEIPCKSAMERTEHQRYNGPTLKGGNI